MRSHAGLLRLALAFAALLGSLSLAVWRQSRALELLATLDEMRTSLASSEAQRSELTRRTAYLERRGRSVAAPALLGLRVPSGDEIVILPLGATAPRPGNNKVAATMHRAGESLP